MGNRETLSEGAETSHPAGEAQYQGARRALSSQPLPIENTGGTGEVSSRRSAAVSTGPHHEPWELTDEEREAYRLTSELSRAAKSRALRGEGPAPVHAINTPSLDPSELMPSIHETGLTALSLFSGGGGLDLGFTRAGIAHVASYELLADAAATLEKNLGSGAVFGGSDGDVTRIESHEWRRMYGGDVAIVHGGPPCQPFSSAGRQRGNRDSRDLWPQFIECVLAVEPMAFVAENVPALLSNKFASYVRTAIEVPLAAKYRIFKFELRAEWFGVPQIRRRIVFVGFRRKVDADRFEQPAPTHHPFGSLGGDLPVCIGARQALGLSDVGFDALAPTIRSGLTGPRHTTSVVSSVSAHRAWDRLQIWPNGVAPSRERARLFVADNRHFRMSVPDCAVLQGFPEWWEFIGATYMALGQIGNAVPPPLAYAVARAVASACR
jgi:DNA (cytosine-5)-methyltransferase 1